MTIAIFINAVILATSVFLLSTTRTPHIISTEGVDNIKVRQSTLKDVRKAFPEGKKLQIKGGWKVVPVSVLWNNGSSSLEKMYEKKTTTTYYTDEKEGISFYFAYTDTVSDITIWGKNFSTDEGIVLGKSNFHDLDSIYGTKEWYYTSSEHLNATVWDKFYKNIDFQSVDTLKVKCSDNLLIDHICISSFD